MIFCIIDIGNSCIKIAFFQNDTLIKTFSFDHSKLTTNEVQDVLSGFKVKSAFVASVNEKIEQTLCDILDHLCIPYDNLDISQLSLTFSVQEPSAVGHDRIANVYGALHHFPTSDCLIVDIGTAVTFDFVTKEGNYLGGAIYPGCDISAKALSTFTDKLPLANIVKPSSPLGKTTIEHIQSGIYYGLLGAIERILDEIRSTSLSPSSIKILATGGATRIENTAICEAKRAFTDDLKDLVDFINPHLTLLGLYEIFKEHLSKKQEK
jgi:type III pantothenate kinase